eukprot:1318337-Amphidinium_carterae.1
MDKNRSHALGQWFSELQVITGSKDRPGDILEKGTLIVEQWVQDVDQEGDDTKPSAGDEEHRDGDSPPPETL